MRHRWAQITLSAVGALVVVGHLVALAFLGMTASGWISGTAIGLVLAVIGGAHLLLAPRTGEAAQSRWTQVAFGLLALAVGIVEGLIVLRLPGAAGWWLIPWAFTALAIGLLLPGPPVEKAARLAAFGFSSVLVLTTGGGDVHEPSGVVFALGWSIAAAGGAVAIGAGAHVVVGWTHVRAAAG